MASSTEFRLSSGYIPKGMLATFLGLGLSARFSPGRCNRGLGGPLIETSSPLLEKFTACIEELEATFGDTNRRQTTLTKLYSFQQGSRPASVYASEFHQISCDVSWDDQALCDHFRRGSRNDVETLLLNFPDPTSWSPVISQVVQCDNRLFELRQEEQGTSASCWETGPSGWDVRTG